MKTNAPYKAQELANQAAYMRAVAMSDDAGLSAEARMEVVVAIAASIIRMVVANTEHWERIIASRRVTTLLSSKEAAGKPAVFLSPQLRMILIPAANPL